MDPNTETVTPTETPAEETVEAAMDRGIEAATETPAEPVEPVAPQAGEGEPVAEATPEGEVVKTPEELAAEAVKPAEEVKADEPKPDADTEKEIADLGIKNGKTAERFRELAGEVKAAAPVMAALKDSGIPVEQLPSALQAARDHREWVQTVVDTGATPQQYDESLQLLTLVSKAQQGDHAAAEAALQALAPVVASIAKLTGREVPGLFDPIDAHADLKEAVESGDMTKKGALEIVRARQLAANTAQLSTQRQQADQATQAQQAGVNALIAIDAEFKAADPQYAIKRPILDGIVQSIRESLPPEQWDVATRRAYARIQVPAAPAPVVQATPIAGHVPLRPTGARGNLQPEFTDPMEAMEAGIRAAGG